MSSTLDHLADLREHMTMNYTTDVRASIAWAVREIEQLRQDLAQHLNNASEVMRLQTQNQNLLRALAAKQAKIDALMLEFCPGEMSAEQREEWAKHQQPVSADMERSITDDYRREHHELSKSLDQTSRCIVCDDHPPSDVPCTGCGRQSDEFTLWECRSCKAMNPLDDATCCVCLLKRAIQS